MTAYYFHDNEGRILETGEYSVAPPPTRDGWVMVHGQATLDDYHDSKTNTVRAIPDRPSDAHQFDYSIKAWVDPRTLNDLKEATWQEIKTAREAEEFGGFEVNGYRYDSDQISQSRIQGACQLATMDVNFTIDWTLADNTSVSHSAAEMLAVGVALGQHVSILHAKARALRQLIDTAATPEELNLVVW